MISTFTYGLLDPHFVAFIMDLIHPLFFLKHSFDTFETLALYHDFQIA